MRPLDAAGTEFQAHVPDSGLLLDVFSGLREPSQRDLPVVVLVRALVATHLSQWDAEDASRSASSDHDVARAKALIDALNARRVTLVEQIDDHVGDLLSVKATAPLHTETVGSVVDRLTIAWVRSFKLSESRSDLASVAQRQLLELATAYDDLVRDIAAGTRRVPRWRQLKRYADR